ncbi:MAG: hypothetical protein IPG02_07800 [Ignavibacteria bacterium]|nr:hypothetical protein [Ignavibacteria bacterium]
MIWERTYRDGFISADSSRLVLDSADNIYASGFFDTLSTEAMAAFKYDSSGNRQYVVSYFYTPVGWNYPFDLAVDRRGSVYLTGRSNRALCTVKFSEIPTGVTPLTGLPTDFILHQNFPNPFNPKTIINYELRIRNFVLLKVYDIAGREVATLVNEIMPAGKHASGVQCGGSSKRSLLLHPSSNLRAGAQSRRVCQDIEDGGGEVIAY